MKIVITIFAILFVAISTVAVNMILTIDDALTVVLGTLLYLTCIVALMILFELIKHWRD